MVKSKQIKVERKNQTNTCLLFALNIYKFVFYVEADWFGFCFEKICVLSFHTKKKCVSLLLATFISVHFTLRPSILLHKIKFAAKFAFFALMVV